MTGEYAEENRRFVVTATRPDVEIDPERIEEYVLANFDPGRYSELKIIDQETHEVVYDARE